MKKNFTKQDFYNMLKQGGPNGDCLEWTGAKIKTGYGRTFVDTKAVYTHRLALELEGIDTTDKIVMHSCDNPSCCNPNHLTIGTTQDNLNDMRKKGRGFVPPSTGSSHGKSKLTDNDVIEIKTLFKNNTQMSSGQISKKYNVSRSAISLIKCGINWTHIKV